MTKGNEIEDLLFKYGRFIIFKFYENRYYKDTRWKSSFIKAKEILLEYNLMNPFILLLTTALIMELSLIHISEPTRPY